MANTLKLSDVHAQVESGEAIEASFIDAPLTPILYRKR